MEGKITPGAYQPRRDFLRSMLFALPAALVAPDLLADTSAPPDLSTLPALFKARLDFKSRTAWTAEKPELRRLKKMTAYRRVTVHHAGNGIDLHSREADILRDLDGIRGAHLRRNFGDIGYHFAIDRSGRVWEARSLAYAGAHVQGHNQDNIGVMLFGNFEKQRPSSRQISSLRTVTKILHETFGMAGGEVYGHKDLGHTLCPGRYLYSYVKELKKA